MPMYRAWTSSRKAYRMTIRREVHIGKHLSHFVGVYDLDINIEGDMANCGIGSISWASVTRLCPQPSLQCGCCRCSKMPSSAIRTPILFSDTLKHLTLVAINDFMAFVVPQTDSRNDRKRWPQVYTNIGHILSGQITCRYYKAIYF